MSEIVVRVENLGKQYFLGHQRSNDFRQTFRNAFNNFWRGQTRDEGEFWALRNLTFELRRGDVVGIVGRNGGGKSTLLKILSRITQPTEGRFEIDGRVSSLLEVGTGFHMELTGRENIFLNGTILGMRRAEIKSKFDEIVTFSGVENFIDTPVKHYSSGMAVRLAFSVAAHLEPEILIVDEVLAVGDAEFQKKCLGKMNEVSKKEGRTILFVSHNMAAVEHLCTRALLLNEGRMVRQGHVSEVVSEYLHAGLSHVGSNGGTTLATGVFLRDFRLQETNIQVFDDLEYEIKIESARPNSVTELVILIYNHLNERVGVVDLRHKELPEKSLRNSGFTVRGKIKHLPLIEGTYHCGLFISCLLCRGDFFNLASFEVHRSEFDFVPYSPNHRGYLEFDNSFTVD